jgi:hypothetical protein
VDDSERSEAIFDVTIVQVDDFVEQRRHREQAQRHGVGLE